MSNIITARDKTPEISENCFIAPNAYIIGDVKIGQGSSVWFNVTIRGDVMPIHIGSETNIQDGSVIHGTFEKYAASIGNRVTIGHSVVLHGCKIDDLCLIGMGSIIMDNAHISKRSIVAAGSLVTEGKHFPEGVLIVGRPAQVARPLTDEELGFLDKSADNYITYKSWY